MKIAFIGGGNMGEAILAALIRQEISTPSEICVHDASAERLEYLKQKYAVVTADCNSAAIAGAEVIILAIKPQTLGQVGTELAGKIEKGQLVMSIIAGKKLSTLGAALRCESIVRAMPNTPAQIGRGVTVWTTLEKGVTPAQWGTAAAILNVMGKAIYVEHEKYLDMATAVSGSGPAYVFLFMESLTAAAVAIGLPEDIAAQLVQQTVAGSAEYAAVTNLDLAELRRRVTSPGGTTAAALQGLSDGQFDALIASAVCAAHTRAKELGEQDTV